MRAAGTLFAGSGTAFINVISGSSYFYGSGSGATYVGNATASQPLNLVAGGVTQAVLDGTGHFILGTDPGGTEQFRMSGAMRAAAAKNYMGLVSTTGLTSLLIDGGNSGGNGGSSIYFRQNGTTNVAIGNVSAVLGGSYDNRGCIWAPSGLFLNPTVGSVMVGSDPGGPELLRVGGGACFTGNVGVGTPSPSTKFQVRDVFGDSLAFYQPGNNVFAIQTLLDEHPLLNYGNFGGGQNQLNLQPLVGDVIIGTDPTGPGALRVGGGAIFAGNVGIGTIDPSAKFQVRDVFGDSLAFYQPRNNVFAIQTLLDEHSLTNYGVFGGGQNQLNLQPLVGDVIIGNDPVGTGTLRVGGGANFFGNVGIGVANPTSKLAVAGTISASEVKVTANPADYVFADDYKLRPLSEIETHVKIHRHLPGVPQWR